MNYTVNPTTFVEATYGFIRNELAGGNEGGVLDQRGGQPADLAARLPAALPERRRGQHDGYYAYEVLDDVEPALWDGTR